MKFNRFTYGIIKAGNFAARNFKASVSCVPATSHEQLGNPKYSRPSLNDLRKLEKYLNYHYVEMHFAALMSVVEGSMKTELAQIDHIQTGLQIQKIDSTCDYRCQPGH